MLAGNFHSFPLNVIACIPGVLLSTSQISLLNGPFPRRLWNFKYIVCDVYKVCKGGLGRDTVKKGPE